MQVGSAELEEAELAQRWCRTQGAGWVFVGTLGKGGTAPVFEVTSPEGPRALKIYSERFSTGKLGAIEKRRVDQQLALRGHECPHLVQIYDGGLFEGRLFLLMGRAPGRELEKRLRDIPRDKIRTVIDQIAKAAIFLKSKGLCHRDIKSANVFISDDFEYCTLLDVSVLRDVFDPIGLGTDHENQLPVVATARYSPPEYLFRLLEPSLELWHALNVYQLGGLLHDLIMRQPLFQEEYLAASENRYRFAWVVATVPPKIAATDVDQDLLLTAQRALDKDWQRRSVLQLEDFLADRESQQRQALRVLGLSTAPEVSAAGSGAVSVNLKIESIARNLDDAMVAYLKLKGVTVKHSIVAGPYDSSRLLTLRWSAIRDTELLPVQLDISIAMNSLQESARIQLNLSLKLGGEEAASKVSMMLPEVVDGPNAATDLASQAQTAFEELAVDITRAAR